MNEDTKEEAGCILLATLLFTFSIAAALGMLAALVYVLRWAWVAAS